MWWKRFQLASKACIIHGITKSLITSPCWLETCSEGMDSFICNWGLILLGRSISEMYVRTYNMDMACELIYVVENLKELQINWDGFRINEKWISWEFNHPIVIFINYNGLEEKKMEIEKRALGLHDYIKVWYQFSSYDVLNLEPIAMMFNSKLKKTFWKIIEVEYVSGILFLFICKGVWVYLRMKW